MCVCIYAYARIMCVLGFVFLRVCGLCQFAVFACVCFGNLSAQVKSTFKPLLRSAPVT